YRPDELGFLGFRARGKSMRLLGAVVTSLVAVSLAAAQPEPRRVKTERIPLDGAGLTKSEAKGAAKEEHKGKAKGKQAKGKPGAKAKKPEKAEEAEKAEKTEKVSKEVAGSYNAIPLAERVAIQSDLAWTGFYNGVLSGEFGERSVAAV